MFRAIILLLLTAALAGAVTIRLYTKDGEYQLVREYKVDGDRVRYFSTERGEWEEVPLELVDLKRTEKENRAREEAIKEEATLQAAEEKAERDARREVARIPVEPGVYQVNGDQLKTIPPAESKVVTDKKRSILKAMSPVPIVAGKATLEVDGEHSPNVVASNTPEFYIRLSADEHFGLLRVESRKGVRILEKLNLIPVTKEIVEDQDEVEVFRHQVGDGLYKIWPMKPLQAGEYAVVEFTPATSGSVNLQAWDFNVPEAIGSKDPIERKKKDEGPPKPAKKGKTSDKKK